MDNEEKKNSGEPINPTDELSSVDLVAVIEEVVSDQTIFGGEEENNVVRAPSVLVEAVQTLTESTSAKQGEELNEPFVEERVVTEPVTYKAISSLSFKERQEEAINIATYFAEMQQENIDFARQLKLLKSKFPVLSNLDVKYFPHIICTINKLTESQTNNIFSAYVLFYVFTAGRYPQDYWKGVTERLEDTTLGKIRAMGKEFSLKFSQAGNGKLADKINEITKGFQRQTEDLDIGSLVSMEESVGIARIYELFWEVFVMKYGNYRPSFWKNKLTEFYGKKYAIRELCEFKEQSKNVDIYAVSYEGKLNKPLHYVCEDCSFATIFDENTWLAVSADGVGSCENSYIGSQLATEILGETIADYLQKNNLVSDENENQGIINESKPVDEDAWAKLMYYLRFKLAYDFYNAWEAAVKMSKEFQGDPSAEIGQFTSTLQFAFGCKAFIACGRIGDGSFFVRKRERSGNSFYYGGTLLDDCISGVTQTAVLTIAHLKTNPSALQVDFFRADEITDIIISSDGVSSALGYTVEEVNKLACELSKLPFEKRCEELSRMARFCSDYNETQHGSGDDCTIVHVSLKN